MQCRIDESLDQIIVDLHRIIRNKFPNFLQECAHRFYRPAHEMPMRDHDALRVASHIQNMNIVGFPKSYCRRNTKPVAFAQRLRHFERVAIDVNDDRILHGMF